jgi:hypothetical protein
MAEYFAGEAMMEATCFGSIFAEREAHCIGEG